MIYLKLNTQCSYCKYELSRKHFSFFITNWYIPMIPESVLFLVLMNFNFTVRDHLRFQHKFYQNQKHQECWKRTTFWYFSPTHVPICISIEWACGWGYQLALVILTETKQLILSPTRCLKVLMSFILDTSLLHITMFDQSTIITSISNKIWENVMWSRRGHRAGNVRFRVCTQGIPSNLHSQPSSSLACLLLKHIRATV